MEREVRAILAAEVSDRGESAGFREFGYSVMGAGWRVGSPKRLTDANRSIVEQPYMLESRRGVNNPTFTTEPGSATLMVRIFTGAGRRDDRVTDHSRAED